MIGKNAKTPGPSAWPCKGVQGAVWIRPDTFFSISQQQDWPGTSGWDLSVTLTRGSPLSDQTAFELLGVS